MNMRNRVTLIGRLGKEPEIIKLESGKVKARFTVATNDPYKNSEGETVEDVEWHNLVAWGKLAENIGKYLKKGSEAAFEGKITSRKYEDKDGVSRNFTEIVVNDMLLLDKKMPETLAQ